MTPEEHDAEDYFEALAGKRPEAKGAAALREALLAQKKVLDAADRTSLEDLDEEDARARAAPARTSWQTGLRQTWARWTSAGVWPRSLAVAMSVVLASALVLKIGLPQGGDTEDPSGVVRGSEGLTIGRPDPQAVARDLALRLQATGADIVLVKISEDEWSMNVNAAEPAVKNAADNLLREAGFKPSGSMPYEFSIRRRP